MERLICIAVGYACGLLQTSYIYGKMHGIDIREHGSGNAGTTNALRTLGKKAGLITLLGDALKCVLAVIIVCLIFGKSHPDSIKLLKLYASAGTILGHNFPFYLKFKGGKGIAATAGMLAAFDIRLALAALAVFIITVAVSHYVSLGSLLVYATFVIGTVVMGQTGLFGMEQCYLNEIYVVAVLLEILAVWKHRSNIGRLIAGNENKTYIAGKKKES